MQMQRDQCQGCANSGSRVCERCNKSRMLVSIIPSRHTRSESTEQTLVNSVTIPRIIERPRDRSYREHLCDIYEWRAFQIP